MKGERKMRKVASIVAMVLAMVCVFSGCDFKAEKEYEANLQTVLEEIASSKQDVDDSMTSVAGSIGDLEEVTEETFQPVLEKIKVAEEKCETLGALEAPEKYAEMQNLIKQSADKMLEAYGKYRDGINLIVEARDESALEEITTVLTEGDDAMTEAGNLMTQAGNLQGENE